MDNYTEGLFCMKVKEGSEIIAEYTSDLSSIRIYVGRLTDHYKKFSKEREYLVSYVSDIELTEEEKLNINLFCKNLTNRLNEDRK